MILMLINNIDNLNNAVRDVFVEYGLDSEVNFLYSQYPDRSDIQCNELLKHKDLDSLNSLINKLKENLLKLEEVSGCEIEKDLFISESELQLIEQNSSKLSIQDLGLFWQLTLKTIEDLKNC